jgi:hypothetical protein
MERRRACVYYLDDWRGLALGIITQGSGSRTFGSLCGKLHAWRLSKCSQSFTTRRTQARIALFAKKKKSHPGYQIHRICYYNGITSYCDRQSQLSCSPFPGRRHCYKPGQHCRATQAPRELTLWMLSCQYSGLKSCLECARRNVLNVIASNRNARTGYYRTSYLLQRG